MTERRERLDLAQAFGAAAPSRAAVWEFVEAFAESWMAPLSPADGIAPSEVRRAEERLGYPLPAALSEAYALFGRRTDLVAVHNPLLAPEELLLDPSGELLVFRSENQGCAGWGVPLDRLGDDDPPVGLFSDHLPGVAWKPYLDRLSLAFAELVLSEAAMAHRYGPCGRECPATAEAVAAVEATYQPIALPPCPAWYHPEGEPTRWFSAPGKLLCLEPDPVEPVLAVAGQSETEVLEILATVPGAWSAVEPVPYEYEADAPPFG
ncbi:SMI1/KNR4 family protein [Streptomyces rimosus]|uniref:SMI1/KNR4 family protein n=1 Tax=Streptomyces rimosus TaxID=1927 RepID=UPI0031DF7B90